MRGQLKNRLSVCLSLVLFLTAAMPYNGILRNFSGLSEVNAETIFTTTEASVFISTSAAVLKVINNEKVETTSPSAGFVKVKSKQPGYAHLVVKEGTDFYQYKITIGEDGKIAVASKEKVVNATGLKMTTTAASIKIGETYDLSVKFVPANTSFQYVKWSSDNTGVAGVDSNGKVTAKAKGTAKITAVWDDYIGNTTPSALTTSAVITVVPKDSKKPGGSSSDDDDDDSSSGGSSSSATNKDTEKKDTTNTTEDDSKVNKDTDKKTDKIMEKYVDVNKNNWFYDAVEYVVSNGMMVGVSDDSFAPNIVVTRAMIVQALYNFEKKPAGFSSNFADVSKDKWYYDAVSWGQTKGIVSGFGNGTFNPNGDITREQMVVILYNYAKLKGFDMTSSDKVSSFKDGAMVSKWAVKAMNWAVHNGIVSGMGDGNLSPKTGTTRAQLAMMLKNFYEKF